MDKKFVAPAILIGICAVLVGGLSYWAGSPAPEVQLQSGEITSPLVAEEQDVYEPKIENDMNPIAVLETNHGTIEIELYQNVMPITAGNFAKLISEGFYDGVLFHRVIKGFMIQGGDPNTKTDNVFTYGTGGPGYAIADEFVKNELLTNERGTIAMANSGPNTGGSQFFINLGDNSYLDFDKDPLTSKHPVFGRVISGMDIVDEIANVATNERDLPAEPVVIEHATLKEMKNSEASE